MGRPLVAILLDTGPFALLLTNSIRISDDLRGVIAKHDIVLVPAITFYEIGQKVRIGKWPEMAPYIDGLEQRARDDGYEVVALTAAVCLQAALLDWPHRDPFDRMIAAAALQERVPVVSPDAAFDQLGLERIWERQVSPGA